MDARLSNAIFIGCCPILLWRRTFRGRIRQAYSISRRSARLINFNKSNSITAGKIAFASDRDGNWEIYVMNADGSGQTRLTKNPARDEFPDWSPDGKKIAFVSGRDGTIDTYVMNADGTGQARLTTNPADDYRPAWSPDGSKIAFMAHRDGNTEIYVMNADGSSQTNLTQNQADDWEPSWSPMK